MTYWEDTPVSRINLGKKNYGGPFTNEKVEDVKTFLRVSVLFFGVTFYLGCLYLHSHSVYYVDHGTKNSLSIVNPLTEVEYIKNIIYTFSSRYTWWVLVFVFVHELILVPVRGYRISNILR